MRRSWAIVAVFVGLMASPALGQRRGGGFSGHPASGFRGGAVSRGPVFRGGIRPGSGFHPGAPFRPPFVSNNRFGRNRFFLGGGYQWGYPYYGGYYFDPGFYADYPAPAPSYAAPPSYLDNSAQEQQDEINRLEDEVDRLREERENRAQPPAKPQPQPQPATELIFQDKHSEEVQNYAIVGQTLWIFTETRARKVALADLDIPATTKANEDRGVDFALPQ